MKKEVKTTPQVRAERGLGKKQYEMNGDFLSEGQTPICGGSALSMDDSVAEARNHAWRAGLHLSLALMCSQSAAGVR